MEWTTKRFALLMGVSTRTLHYYDEIGLLKPSAVDKRSGYRYYNEDSLAAMSEILFYRELGFPLERIRDVLTMPEQLRRQAVAERGEELFREKERIERLIALTQRVARGEDLHRLVSSFDKNTLEPDERTTSFYELLDEADRLLENDTVNEQIVLVKTAKGNLYHTVQNPQTGYDPMKDIAFMDMLLSRDDAQVRYIVVLWNPRVAELIDPDIAYALDVPGWCLRRGLPELAGGNEDALILLRGEGLCNVRTLKSIQPPQAGLDAEWERICKLREK